MNIPDLATSMSSIAAETFPCPNCHGLGHMLDGALTVGPDGITDHKPATVCWVCDGKRRVRVLPLEG